MSASIRPDSSSSLERRPAPGFLWRPGGSASGSSSSRIPLRIVRSEIPVAMATAVMPPQPSDLASAAAHLRRPRSSRSEKIARYLSRIHSTTCASGIRRRSHKSYNSQIEFSVGYCHARHQRPLLGAFLMPPALPVVNDSSILELDLSASLQMTNDQ